MTNTENIEEMVRDFCSVAPKSKSEVRQRISESIAQALAEERERVGSLIQEIIDEVTTPNPSILIILKLAKKARASARNQTL